MVMAMVELLMVILILISNLQPINISILIIYMIYCAVYCTGDNKIGAIELVPMVYGLMLLYLYRRLKTDTSSLYNK